MARESKGRKDTVQKTVYFSTSNAEAIKALAEREGISENMATQMLLEKSLKSSDMKASAPMILVFANYKGGVAKTITCGNLAYMLASKGHRVLVIDLDGQGDLSKYLGQYDPTPEAPCVLDVMVSKDGAPRKALEDVIVHTDYDNLNLVPSSLRFNGGEGKMKNEAGAVNLDARLKYAIEDMIDAGITYDYILIDCSPTLDLVVTNALIALEAGNEHSLLVLPVKLEGFALAGANETVDMTERICRERRVRKSRYMVLRTMAERNTNAYQVANDLILETFGKERVFSTVIDKNTKINDSTLLMEPAVAAAASTEAKEYLQFQMLMQEVEDINNG